MVSGYLELPGACLVPGEAVTDAAHDASLPSHRAEAEPAVREAGSLVPRHQSGGAGAHELDLHLQLEARHSVGGGTGDSVGSSPEKCWSEAELVLRQFSSIFKSVNQRSVS